MSANAYFTIAALAVIFKLVFTAPAPHPKVVLSDALNHTICPIQVEIDEDEHRIPKRIKLLKCAPGKNKLCVERGIPDQECCRHNHNNHVLACAEVHDTVLVYYPNSADHNKMKSYDVAVGCSCLLESSSLATRATR